jgi:hypothetical protein
VPVNVPDAPSGPGATFVDRVGGGYRFRCDAGCADEDVRAALRPEVLSALDAEFRRNGADAGPEGGGVAEALAAARVDLVQLIRDGIPEREFVPGGDGWLIAGKRYQRAPRFLSWSSISSADRRASLAAWSLQT